MKLPYYPNRAGSRRMLIALAWTTCILPAHSAELEFSLLASSDNFTLGSEFAVIDELAPEVRPLRG